VPAPQEGWARWLFKERFGGDETVARNWLTQLGQLRDRILRSARLQAGDVLLDVGCGDGLLGFGALSQVGSNRRVIFSDQSKELVEKCREIAVATAVADQCISSNAMRGHCFRSRTIRLMRSGHGQC
jgi:arsenite methyltransferase